MIKLVLTTLTLAFSLNAFASHPICADYNDLVSKQCVSASKLKNDLTPEMLRGYTVSGCRNVAFKSILEADPFADASCKPVMAGKLISALK